MSFLTAQLYTIRSYQTEKIYIGATIQTLARRLAQHVSQYKSWKLDNTKTYVTSFNIIKYDDYYIELLESFPCNNKDELNKREGELIRSHDCVNRCVPGRTRKQYYEENKVEISRKKKIYADEHKVEAAIWGKQWRSDNEEKLQKQKKEYYKDNKTDLNLKMKEHYIKNTEKLKLYQKNRRTKYDTKIKKFKNKKHMCEYCNIQYSQSNKNRHVKTTRHQNSYKAAYLECWGEVFTGVITSSD
jgi:inorganic triphosphatase YgiF